MPDMTQIASGRAPREYVSSLSILIQTHIAGELWLLDNTAKASTYWAYRGTLEPCQEAITTAPGLMYLSLLALKILTQVSFLRMTRLPRKNSLF
jgi:hypothetical protein